jgi:hypothetical protein
MKKEKIIFAILILGFLASCGPKRYGCGPRRCEMKVQPKPFFSEKLEKIRTS